MLNPEIETIKTNLLAPTDDECCYTKGKWNRGKRIYRQKSIHQKSKRSDFPFVAIRLWWLFRKRMAASEYWDISKDSLQVL